MRWVLVGIFLAVGICQVQAKEWWVRAFPDQDIDGLACVRNNNIHWKNGVAVTASQHPPLPDGNGYECIKLALAPLFFGVLTLQTGPNPQRYEIVAIELERKDGLVHVRKHFNDALVNKSRQKGRLLIIPPSDRPREFLLVMRYVGPKAGAAIMAFESINPLVVGMMAAGRTALMEGIGGYVGNEFGSNSQEREIINAMTQLVMGAAVGDDLDNQDAFLNSLAMAIPHLHKDIPPVGIGIIWNTFQELKSRSYAGFNRSYGLKPYGG